MTLDDQLGKVNVTEKIKQINEENEEIAHRDVLSYLVNIAIFAGTGCYMGLTNQSMIQLKNVEALFESTAVASIPTAYLSTIFLYNEGRIKDIIKKQDNKSEQPQNKWLKKLKDTGYTISAGVGIEGAGVGTDLIAFSGGYVLGKWLTKILNK